MIAIVDYKAGNVTSVKNALARLGHPCTITSDPQVIKSAEGVIFPGQGRAGAAMSALKKTTIDNVIPYIKKPFLGICVGMQLLSRYTEEDHTQGLAVFEEISRRFPPTLKTPHLGWNTVEFKKTSTLTTGIANKTHFYFAHSYYVDGADQTTIGTTGYGFDFPSVMQKNNFFAVQFHPEKSGTQGEQILTNFCKLCS